MTKEQDEVLRTITQKNKICEFAMNVLGMDERRAEVFEKACADRFVWDGTLRFKGVNGEVPADDPQCTGFFQREYDFLVPEKKVEGHQAEIPADLIAKAKAGHVTAQGTVFKLLHGDNKDTPIENAKTRAKFDALMKGEKPKGDTTPKDKPRDTGGKFVANGDTNNPFTRLRSADGTVNAAAAAEIAGMTKALGTKKVEAIARAVGKTITGLPLRA